MQDGPPPVMWTLVYKPIYIYIYIAICVSYTNLSYEIVRTAPTFCVHELGPQPVYIGMSENGVYPQL